MTPIRIDLRDLTQAHLDEALPHLGACSYAAPCIIGTLIPVKHRARLDRFKTGFLNVPSLFEAGVIEFAEPDQLAAARDLQNLFDSASLSDFIEDTKRWVSEQVT